MGLVLLVGVVLTTAQPPLGPQQQSDLIAQADQLDANWGPGGTDRQILTTLTAAAGSNVICMTAQLEYQSK